MTVDAALGLSVEAIDRAGRTGLFLAIGLVHLLLFAFYPRERTHLLFSLFAISLAGVVFLSFLLGQPFSPGTLRLLGPAFALALGVASSALLAFLYSAFAVRVPKLFWAAVAGWAVYALVQAVAPAWGGAFGFFLVLNLFTTAEAVRITVLALLRRVDGAWIVGCGVFAAALVPPKEVLLAAGMPIPAVLSTFIDRAYTVVIVVSISVYLARNFARTNRQLAVRLVEVQELSARTLEQERRAAEVKLQHEQERARLALIEAENARRARELEEARLLQISMLPRSVPEMPNLEIAAYMQPAAEVGGDYYDFRLGADGTLTVAVGDATGHGLKAGMMVTAAKSLFESLAEGEIPHILETSSAALQRMNLRALYMALLMVRIEGRRMTVGAAGMPPVLLYRAERQEVEEVEIPGLPLGSRARFPYRQTELPLAAGDLVVLMSDGFPERLNGQDEMLGYERTKATLAEAAALAPQEVIARFVETAEAWAGGRAQDDDVTFVVIRVRGAPPECR